MKSTSTLAALYTKSTRLLTTTRREHPNRNLKKTPHDHDDGPLTGRSTHTSAVSMTRIVRLLREGGVFQFLFRFGFVCVMMQADEIEKCRNLTLCRAIRSLETRRR